MIEKAPRSLIYHCVSINQSWVRTSAPASDCCASSFCSTHIIRFHRAGRATYAKVGFSLCICGSIMSTPSAEAETSAYDWRYLSPTVAGDCENDTSEVKVVWHFLGLRELSWTVLFSPAVWFLSHGNPTSRCFKHLVFFFLFFFHGLFADRQEALAPARA